MKKVLSIVLVAVLAMAMFAPLAVSADDPKAYNIPKAAAAPTIDGKINADEWEKALVFEMKPGDSNLFAGSGTAEDYQVTAKFQFMWNADGMYFSVVTTGNAEAVAVPTTASGSYNSGNGIQFNIYANRDLSGSAVGDTWFFSYHPKTSDGVPQVGEHFVYGTGGAGGDVTEAKIAVVMNGNDYSMEGLVPAAAFTKPEAVAPITIASGAKLYWNNVVMFTTADGAQGIVIDNEWFNGAYSNEYTLVDDLAGIGSTPPPTEAPTEAVPVEAAVGGGEAADAEVAPAVQAAVAPQTGDSGIVVIMLVLAVVSSAVVFVKKAKSRA